MTNDYTIDTNNQDQTLRTLRPEEELQQDAPLMEDMAPDANNIMLQMEASAMNCPFCGSMMDADADFCEACHRYVKSDICSYCGNSLKDDEAYCPECGNPRGGLVCPQCHTMNDFAFCKQCGAPLTDEAKMMVREIMLTPDHIELQAAIEQMTNLENCLPYTTERDIVCQQLNEKLRERVLSLLAKDKGVEDIVIKPLPETRMPEDVLRVKKEEAMNKVTELLEKMALVKADTPVKARNYSMATKPVGVRLAWVCNYKHAMHSSPCGCAKPHLGGKWVILGRGTKGTVKDDN